ncbi:unnamed protein product [Paramecium octaurelia]|uniref:Uncharacterized protein n=1 Tax=Paramecium octaurelia TaxID=43137 RepID=A0A8S1U3W5_PAROT|nr:unnamed protein product [Paramecium octaurelia]
MNTSTTQNLEGQTMICQFHNNEIITAVNLNLSITGNATHLCNNCLVDKTNDNKILKIMEAKSYKKQWQQRRKNEIEITLTQFQNLFKNIVQFKFKVNSSNFWEDVKLLQEFISKPEDQMEFHYINQMQSQFQQVSDDIDYLQTIEPFENAKKIITNFNVENQIQLEPPKLENNIKTLSLSTLCKDHHKEIVLIDIDSENLQTEKRLACVRCKSNGSSQKLKTVQEIDELWNQKKQNCQSIKVKEVNYRSQMNKFPKLVRITISSQIQLLRKFFQPIIQICKTSKIKQNTIQQLSYEELLSVIDDLVQQDKEMVTLDDYKITKDVESKLEKLKYDFQVDIQKSINYLNDQSNQDFQLLGDRQILEIYKKFKRFQMYNQNNKQEYRSQMNLQFLQNNYIVRRNCQIRLKINFNNM